MKKILNQKISNFLLKILYVCKQVFKIFRIKEKKNLIKSLEFYYRFLIKKFLRMLKNNQEIEKDYYFKKLLFFKFLGNCCYFKQNLRKHFQIFDFFQKNMKSKYMIRKLRDYNNKRKGLKSYLKLSDIKLKKYQKRNFVKKFLNNTHNLNKTNKIIRLNRHFFVKKLFIEFFKKVCIGITDKISYKRKIRDIEELYLINLKMKYFNLFRKCCDLMQNIKVINLRKRILSKIFFEKLKNNYVRIYFYYLGILTHEFLYL